MASWECGIELVLIESPFRSLTGPLLAYVDAIKEIYRHDTINVVPPELVASHWRERPLRNHTALRQGVTPKPDRQAEIDPVTVVSVTDRRGR